MMTGLLRPDMGSVAINGVSVWTDPVAAKRIIGVVPAEVRLFGRLSGVELLEYAGRLHGLGHQCGQGARGATPRCPGPQE
jgi:ABC-2 type transport system ATP-binding protein